MRYYQERLRVRVSSTAWNRKKLEEQNFGMYLKKSRGQRGTWTHGKDIWPR